MKRLHIKIHPFQSQSYNSYKRYIGVYLIGELKEVYGSSSFSFERYVFLDYGIHPMIIEGVKCTLFLWEHIENPSKNLNGIHNGLLVKDDDTKAYEEANNRFKEKLSPLL